MWDKPGWLNWFWQFLCGRLHSFNLKGFYYSCAWSRSLCDGRKLCGFLLTFLTDFTSLSVFFFLYLSPSFSFGTVFDSVSSNIDEGLSINPSANAFVVVIVHHKDWLTYFGGADRPGELCYNFSISSDLTQMVIFPTRIPDWFSQSCSFGFISSDASICSTMAVPPLGNSDHVIVSVSTDFTSDSQRCPVSSTSLWLFSCWLGLYSWSFERCSMGGHL